MTEPTLHPNLAKIAAAYDQIVERHDRQQLSGPEARAAIAQLEARDDAGVRWSIDPDSGQWLRKTVQGDVVFDPEPPTFGYRTADAFDYTAQPSGFDPNQRVQLDTVNESLEFGPSSLAGATQRLPQAQPAGGVLAVLGKAATALGQLPRNVQLGAGVLFLILAAFMFHSCTAAPAPATPMPTVTVPSPVVPGPPAPPAKK